ncbi:MAG TPA: dTDP-4-dehydrorhamnose 3,5-epimerase [Pyrinomonadaceae bacterium]|nr:dTDP-4-dehydrorhamnose 3,5-epimerase [Pyrinomonadaceae bacterium]
MIFQPADDIAEVILVQPDVYEDARGFFMESYQTEKYAGGGITETFVQDNHSGSRRATLRGLHYQIRRPQGKLVRVVAGEVFDVAVDLRRRSPTFGRWVGARLSAENRRQLWIPRGFAHGFYVLSEWAEVLYKATDFYVGEHDRTLLWNDPRIGIAWPLLAGQRPILSDKDRRGLPLDAAEVFEDDF